jgi:hypothetical protein
MTQGKLLEFLEDIDLLESFQLPTKWKNPLQVLPQENMLSEAEFHTLLDTHLPTLGLQQRIRIMEAAAIAFYYQQTDWLVVETLVCNDAPQFNLLTDNIALFWVHQGRRYKKLSQFRLSKGLSLGILSCVLFLLLVSWELSFLNIFVTVFLRLGIFPV